MADTTPSAAETLRLVQWWWCAEAEPGPATEASGVELLAHSAGVSVFIDKA
jgi:hypothetical protein